MVSDAPSHTTEALAQEVETLRKQLQSVQQQLDSQTTKPDSQKRKTAPPSKPQQTAPNQQDSRARRTTVRGPKFEVFETSNLGLRSATSRARPARSGLVMTYRLC